MKQKRNTFTKFQRVAVYKTYNKVLKEKSLFLHSTRNHSEQAVSAAKIEKLANFTSTTQHKYRKTETAIILMRNLPGKSLPSGK